MAVGIAALAIAVAVVPGWGPYADHATQTLASELASCAKIVDPYSGRPQVVIRFGENKGGAIPPNLLHIPNTESNSQYLRCCQMVGIAGHPARFPEKLPEFFIRFLTDVRDTVLDIFAGSNTTGAVAEALGRRWIAFEIDRSYLAASAFRFLNEVQEDIVKSLYSKLIAEGAKGIIIPQGAMQQYLLEETSEYKTS